MKTKILMIVSILTIISCTTTQKEKEIPLNLNHLQQNKDFNKNSMLPTHLTKELLDQGKKNYTVGVVQGNLLSDNEFVFKNDIKIKNSFYTFSTIKKSNELLISSKDQKTIILKGKVQINDKSHLHLRVNTQSNSSDMVIFENLVGSGTIYINAHVIGVLARYSKIPLLEVPLNCNYNFKLFNRIIVNDVEYILEEGRTNNSKIITLKPIFKDSDVANEYRVKEQQLSNKPLQVRQGKYKAVFMREKITLFVDKEMVGSSNIIDIVTK